MQDAEAGLGDECAAVFADAADAFGHPCWVAGEELVVIRCPDEADDPHLHDEVVHDLLGFFFGHRAFGEVALEVDVEEGARATEGHGRAVLVLHRAEVAEVGPLDGFFAVLLPEFEMSKP